ncbi:MAG: hypothetical protein AB7D02_02125, partial [Candidatus Paceibacterota bacterium]
SATVSWSNFSLPIAAGTTKTLSVKVNLAAQDSSFTGGTDKYIQISTEGPYLTGLDANSNVVYADGTDLDSEKFYPFLKAPVFALSSASLTASGSTSATVSDMGTAKIVFTVTANGGDIYLPTDAHGSLGITGQYVSDSATDFTDAEDSWTCTNATEDTTNKFWRITSGSTATCEYNGVFTTSTAGYYYAKISQIDWNTSATTTNAINQNWALDALKTGQTYISGN